jgi:hypothetical protein
MASLLDVAGYPSWSRLVEAAEVLDRAADGTPRRVRVRAAVLGLAVEMDCVLEVGADSATLRRVPYGADDRERYIAAWRVRGSDRGSLVELSVIAELEVPGAAAMVRGRIARRLADDVLSDFARCG